VSLQPLRLVELLAAVMILGAGIWLYRRPAPATEGGGSYGSQGAVILLVVGVIMAIHALGALDYHPSKAEAEYFQEHSH
jgi:hypothetical protein